MTAIDAESQEALIDELSGFPERLVEQIDGCDSDDLTRAGPGGSWGVVEILCHLRDWEEIFIERIEMMLDDDNLKLDPIEDSLWPIDRDYLGQDPEAVLEEFTALRDQSVSILDKIDLSSWTRVGRHPQYGQITLFRYAEYITDHDREHEQQIELVLGKTR